MKLPPFQDAKSLGNPGSSFTLQDFRLFHHYVTSTYITMAAVPSMQHVWRDTIPGVAFSHDFLMQSILATSALHVAHERTPEISTGLMLQPGDMEMAIVRSGLTEQDKEDRKNLLATARSLYDSALPKFRLEMENVGPNNCDALFAFSVMLLPYVCATERNELRESGFSGTLLFDSSAAVGQQDRERASSHLNSLLRWVYLALGVRPVVQVARPFIWNGALFRWLYRHDWNAWPPLDCIEAQQDTAHLDSLETLWRSSPEDWDHAVDESEAAVYSECLQQLKRTVALIYSPTHNPHLWWEREKARRVREEGDLSALDDEEPQDVGHNRSKITWMFSKRITPPPPTNP